MRLLHLTIIRLFRGLGLLMLVTKALLVEVYALWPFETSRGIDARPDAPALRLPTGVIGVVVDA